MPFRLARRTRTVMRMVPVWPESGRHPLVRIPGEPLVTR